MNKKAKQEPCKWIDERTSFWMDRLIPRGLSFDETFDIAYRKVGRELGMSRIEIARLFAKWRDGEKEKARK